VEDSFNERRRRLLAIIGAREIKPKNQVTCGDQATRRSAARGLNLCVKRWFALAVDLFTSN
jgi:hypothetical protein